LEGVLLTMYDQRNNLSELVADDVRRHLGDKVFKAVIPRNVRVSEAPSHGMPVLMYDPRCAGSDAYTDLAIEMLRRNSGVAGERRSVPDCTRCRLSSGRLAIPRSWRSRSSRISSGRI